MNKRCNRNKRSNLNKRTVPLPSIRSFHPHLTTNNLQCGRTPDHGDSGKLAVAVGAVLLVLCVIGNDPLNKTLHQGTFAALAVFQQRRIALGTSDINGFTGAFFIGFSHIAIDNRPLPKHYWSHKVSQQGNDNGGDHVHSCPGFCHI